MFLAWVAISDQYFFQLLVSLKPFFNCCNNFVLSWVETVTTGTNILVQQGLDLLKHQ